MVIQLWAPYGTWSLGRYCEKALQQLGHSVKVADCRRRPLTDSDTIGDLVFVVKGDTSVIPFLDKVKVKKAVWYPDDPHGGKLPLTLAPYFDYVFTDHKPQVPHYKALGIKTFWLPFACDPGVHKPFPVQKKHDFVFVGAIDPRRREFFDRLGKSFSVFAKSGIFLEDMSRSYCSGRIGINVSKSGGITMRVFEVMACNVLLFTDCVENGISELLTPGKHFVHYTESNLIALGKKYLSDPATSKRIAEEGGNVVRGKHTYLHRMQEVLRACSV